jgi:hypothetical protein
VIKIGVVFPTVDGRQKSLEKAIRTTCPPWAEDRDNVRFGIAIEGGHESCGAAWNAGAERLLKDEADFFLFSADDLYPLTDHWYAWALKSCDEAELPGAFVYDEATMQRHDDDGAPGTVVEFSRIPFLPAFLVEEIFPMPELHYYSDRWIGRAALRSHGWRTRLVGGFDFVHAWGQPGRKNDGRATSDLALFDHEWAKL